MRFLKKRCPWGSPSPSAMDQNCRPSARSIDVQLDIFDHSRDVMLRNDVRSALLQFDAAGALTACLQLEQAYPRDATIGPSRLLIQALEQRSALPFADHEAAREAVGSLEKLKPIARHVLGDGEGEGWMVPLWRLAAQRAEALPHVAAQPDLHAAALWLRAKDWKAVTETASRIESWRRIPAPLAWMAQARLHLEGLDAAWPLIIELAWLAPSRLALAWPELGDPLLDRLRKQFEAQFEGGGDVGDLAWFPAWLLTQKAALARVFAAAQPSGHREPERAMRLVVECIGLERQGRQHDLVACRRRLRDIHPGLYDAYMACR